MCLTLSQYYELRQRQAGVAPPDPELKGDDYLELPAAVEVALLGSRGGGEGGASAPRARPAAAQPSLQ